MFKWQPLFFLDLTLCHLLTYFICSKLGSLGSMDSAQGCNRRDDARAGARSWRSWGFSGKVIIIVHCSEYWPTSNPDKGYLPRYRLKRQLDLGSKRSSPRYLIISSCKMCVCVYLCICFTKMLVTKGLVTQGLGLTSEAVNNTRVIWDWYNGNGTNIRGYD